MYGNLTAAGCSRAWEPKDWFCEYLRQANQEAVDKYVRRGIQYVPRSELPAPPHILPVPRSRYLGDSSSVCISFEDYIQESLARNTGDADLVKARVEMVREDFCLLHFVQWFETLANFSSRLQDCTFTQEVPTGAIRGKGEHEETYCDRRARLQSAN